MRKNSSSSRRTSVSGRRRGESSRRRLPVVIRSLSLSYRHGELTRLASEFLLARQINVSRSFIALRSSVRALPTNLSRHFSSRYAVAGWLWSKGGSSARREEFHPLQTSRVVMKTPVKIIKREDRKVTRDVAISSSRTKHQRTTEVIVKSWIIESRERRRADLNHRPRWG